MTNEKDPSRKQTFDRAIQAGVATRRGNLVVFRPSTLTESRRRDLYLELRKDFNGRVDAARRIQQAAVRRAQIEIDRENLRF